MRYLITVFLKLAGAADHFHCARQNQRRRRKQRSKGIVLLSDTVASKLGKLARRTSIKAKRCCRNQKRSEATWVVPDASQCPAYRPREQPLNVCREHPFCSPTLGFFGESIRRFHCSFSDPLPSMSFPSVYYPSFHFNLHVSEPSSYVPFSYACPGGIHTSASPPPVYFLHVFFQSHISLSIQTFECKLCNRKAHSQIIEDLKRPQFLSMPVINQPTDHQTHYRNLYSAYPTS